MRRLSRHHRADLAAAFSVAPLSALGPQMAGTVAKLDPKASLVVAVLDGGTLYTAPVRPFGTHPYPQTLRAGVWSAAKARMDKVTIRDALNMATGMGRMAMTPIGTRKAPTPINGPIPMPRPTRSVTSSFRNSTRMSQGQGRVSI
jgi:hypothetical protein